MECTLCRAVLEASPSGYVWLGIPGGGVLTPLELETLWGTNLLEVSIGRDLEAVVKTEEKQIATARVTPTANYTGRSAQTDLELSLQRVQRVPKFLCRDIDITKFACIQVVYVRS